MTLGRLQQLRRIAIRVTSRSSSFAHYLSSCTRSSRLERRRMKREGVQNEACWKVVRSEQKVDRGVGDLGSGEAGV